MEKGKMETKEIYIKNRNYENNNKSYDDNDDNIDNNNNTDNSINNENVEKDGYNDKRRRDHSKTIK